MMKNTNLLQKHKKQIREKSFVRGASHHDDAGAVNFTKKISRTMMTKSELSLPELHRQFRQELLS